VYSADQITVELVPAATDDVRILVGELDRSCRRNTRLSNCTV